MAEDASSKEDECVEPHLVPPEQIKRYSPVRDPAAEADIARYVEGQARDEIVQHVERVKVEYVLGEKYEIWDVVTDRGRWWVLTNLTNLYSQGHFPSLDYTLSFHIGLMTRIRARSSEEDTSEPDPFTELWRRQEQLKGREARAVEPEDFQAVGLQLRECLLSLMAALRTRTEFVTARPLPKDADFNAWFDIIVNALCPGSSNKQLRHYMKCLGKETWQLVNWLTHDRDANSAATSIAIHSCDTLLGHSIQLLVRDRTDHIDVCPQCNSRDIRTHYDPAIEPQGDYFCTCGVCTWTNHPTD